MIVDLGLLCNLIWSYIRSVFFTKMYFYSNVIVVNLWYHFLLLFLKKCILANLDAFKFMICCWTLVNCQLQGTDIIKKKQTAVCVYDKICCHRIKGAATQEYFKCFLEDCSTGFDPILITKMRGSTPLWGCATLLSQQRSLQLSSSGEKGVSLDGQRRRREAVNGKKMEAKEAITAQSIQLEPWLVHWLSS